MKSTTTRRAGGLTGTLPCKPRLLRRGEGELSGIDIFPSGKPRPSWRGASIFGHRSKRQKHISALNGALATGRASMPIPRFVWDGLDSRPRGGNTREHPFSIIAFVIGCETHDFKQPPGLLDKKSTPQWVTV